MVLCYKSRYITHGSRNVGWFSAGGGEGIGDEMQHSISGERNETITRERDNREVPESRDGVGSNRGQRAVVESTVHWHRLYRPGETSFTC